MTVGTPNNRQMDFDEAVRKITSVIKEDTGISPMLDDGESAWLNRAFRIKVTPLKDGLRVRIYDDHHLSFELHANLTESDIAQTAQTIVRAIERDA
jgi:hypothetical protein